MFRTSYIKYLKPHCRYLHRAMMVSCTSLTKHLEPCFLHFWQRLIWSFAALEIHLEILTFYFWQPMTVLCISRSQHLYFSSFFLFKHWLWFYISFIWQLKSRFCNPRQANHQLGKGILCNNVSFVGVRGFSSR